MVIQRGEGGGIRGDVVGELYFFSICDCSVGLLLQILQINMVDRLFNSTKRQKFKNKPSNIGLFEYMDQNDDCNFESMRQFWNQMYLQYPIQHREHLKRRFRSNDYQFHLGAVFELFTFWLFSKLGYTVTVNPPIGDSQQTPDFSIKHASGEFAYVEVLSMLPNKSEVNDLGFKSEIVRAINNRLTSETRWGNIRFEGDFVRLPNLDSIVSEVATLLSKSESNELEQFSWRNLESCLKVDNVSLHFSWHKRDAIEGKVFPDLIRFTSGGALLDLLREGLRKRLKDKGRRYKSLDAQLLLMVNVYGMAGPSDEDIIDALFGNVQVILEMRDREIVGQIPSRAAHGFWKHEGDPSYRNTSAVVVFKGVAPSATSITSPAFFGNPSFELQHSLSRNSIFNRFLPTANGGSYDRIPADADFFNLLGSHVSENDKGT